MHTKPYEVDAGLPDRTLRSETLIVLALSLGASGVSALISFVGSVTRPGALKNQAATLVGSYAPNRPWLDLAWQIFYIASALAPVALVAHLLDPGLGLLLRLGVPVAAEAPYDGAVLVQVELLDLVRRAHVQVDGAGVDGCVGARGLDRPDHLAALRLHDRDRVG